MNEQFLRRLCKLLFSLFEQQEETLRKNICDKEYLDHQMGRKGDGVKLPAAGTQKF